MSCSSTSALSTLSALSYCTSLQSTHTCTQKSITPTPTHTRTLHIQQHCETIPTIRILGHVCTAIMDHQTKHDTHTCTRTHTYAHTHARTHAHARTHTRTHARTHTHTHRHCHTTSSRNSSCIKYSVTNKIYMYLQQSWTIKSLTQYQQTYTHLPMHNTILWYTYPIP